MEKPKLAYLRNTCMACPAQWEGATANGSHVYIRYRWGWLRCEIANVIVYLEQIGDEFDGSMSPEELPEHLADVFNFDGFELGMSN